MKYIFKNYEINFVYDHSYNHFTLNIENIESNRFYIKEFTIDTFNKLQFEKNSNINNVKSGIHFFEKVLNNQNGYTLAIRENDNILSNFKKIYILTLSFSGMVDEYFEVYCTFDIEERTFTMEEKIIRMMEKMKIQNDHIVNVKINMLETQLNNLQNMILNISNVIGINNKNTISENSIHQVASTNVIKQVQSVNSIHQIASSNVIKQVPSVNSIHQVPSTNVIKQVPSVNSIHQTVSTNNVDEPFIGLNYEEETKENIQIQKSKKNIKEMMKQENHFYDTFYLTHQENHKEIIPKKLFVTHYEPLVQNSSLPNIMNKWYNFVNNPDENIILNIERPYANLFMSSHGKIFIYHSYGGLVNEISLQHFTEIIGFENSVSIKDNIVYIEELFKKHIDEYAQCGDSKTNVLHFFKKFDTFIENIPMNM
jgi:hypothetical protein